MGIEPLLILLQICRLAVPYTLTSVGATFSERGGVVNLALEGMMLVGAFGAAYGQYRTGSALAGIVLALFCGLGVALLFAFITVTLKADQIVAGMDSFAVGTVTALYHHPCCACRVCREG